MHTKLKALAAEAHLTLALMHAQGVVYHLADPDNRSVKYAAVHGACVIFSGFSFLRHLRGHGSGESRDALREHYLELEAQND